MHFENQTVLVSGAGRGIGKEIALSFAREGADIGFADINEETAQATASEIKKLGRRVFFSRTDVLRLRVRLVCARNSTLPSSWLLDVWLLTSGVARNVAVCRGFCTAFLAYCTAPRLFALWCSLLTGDASR